MRRPYSVVKEENSNSEAGEAQGGGRNISSGVGQAEAWDSVGRLTDPEDLLVNSRAHRLLKRGATTIFDIFIFNLEVVPYPHMISEKDPAKV